MRDISQAVVGDNRYTPSEVIWANCYQLYAVVLFSILSFASANKPGKYLSFSLYCQATIAGS